MARIRTVKPELFLHEGLFDLEKSSGLPIIRCWIALFTQADREGRFEWRPRPLGKQCAPYDDFDFALILNAFAQHGYIVKYVVDGREYAYIPTFLEHQCPNQREAASKLPAPTPEAIAIARDTSRCPTCTMHAYACTCTHMHARGERNGTEWNGNGMEGGCAASPRTPEPEIPKNELFPPEPPPSPGPEPEPEPPKRRERAEDVPVPPELDTAEFRETWTAWIASRRAHRYPMSAAFASDKLKAFVRYGPKATAAAMRESVEQGWQGVFPENYDLMTGARRGKRNEPSRTGPGQRYAGAGVGGDHSGAAACVSGPRSEAGARDPAGSAGRVVNGRWVEAG